jgi:two-component system cell cycle response regulator CtrA
MRILLVEDDVTAAAGLSLLLRSCGTMVDQAHTGQQALDLAGRFNYDIAIVDLMLPDIQGYDVIRSMRGGGNDLPVLIMSGLSGPATTVKGLGAGADDFIKKPFENDEILARIDAVMRRRRVGLSFRPIIGVGSVQLDPNIRRVTVGHHPVDLTAKEYDVLELLVLRKGKTLKREDFTMHLYGGVDLPEIKIIAYFVCKIRKKLAEAGAPDVITTIYGGGYTMLDRQTS